MWNVPKNVLISLEIRPSNKVLIQDLHLDPKKYQRIQESHPENWFLYRNKGEGVMVETVLFGKDEQVDSISYFPTTKDSHLRCSSQSKRISRNKKRKPGYAEPVLCSLGHGEAPNNGAKAIHAGL
jgi:hypothetical protein